MGRRDRGRRVERTGTVYLKNGPEGPQAISKAEAEALGYSAPVGPAPDTPPVPAADHEPCYDCPCCVSWTGSLELLRQAIQNHEFVRVVGGECELSCLVCKSIDRAF